MNRPKKIALISSRPQETNVQLSDDLKNSEIKLLSFPLTEIHPLNNYQIFDGVIENIKTYQHIIFISTNAVHFFLERVKKLSLQIPKNLIFSSIGPTTKLLLQKKLSVDVHSPIKTFDSEHLLKEKIYNNVEGQKILIIRGEGGRETLKNAFLSIGGGAGFVMRQGKSEAAAQTKKAAAKKDESVPKVDEAIVQQPAETAKKIDMTPVVNALKLTPKGLVDVTKTWRVLGPGLGKELVDSTALIVKATSKLFQVFFQMNM